MKFGTLAILSAFASAAQAVLQRCAPLSEMKKTPLQDNEELVPFTGERSVRPDIVLTNFMKVVLALKEKQVDSVPTLLRCFTRLHQVRRKMKLKLAFKKDEYVPLLTFIEEFNKMEDQRDRARIYKTIVEAARKIEDAGAVHHIGYRYLKFRTQEYNEVFFTLKPRCTFFKEVALNEGADAHVINKDTLQVFEDAGKRVYTQMLSAARTLLDLEYGFVTKRSLATRFGMLYHILRFRTNHDFAFPNAEDYRQPENRPFEWESYYDVRNPTEMYTALQQFVRNGAQPTGNYDALLAVIEPFLSVQEAAASPSRGLRRRSGIPRTRGNAQTATQ